MKKENFYIIACFAIVFFAIPIAAYTQITITNDKVDVGTTGRIGAGYSPGIEGKTGRQLNLTNQGSIGGRLEQNDYIDIIPAIYFNRKDNKINKDSSLIYFQSRLAFYTENGNNLLGNVTNKSTNGLVIGLPETFIEARNILGSKWTVWAGARYQRYDDIHINDYFYFDDHSSVGFGIQYKNTAFTMLFPSVIDTSQTEALPYSYENILYGATGLTYRQREVMIMEHSIVKQNNYTIKFLAEYHHVEKATTNSNPAYPSDNGWVAGIKLSNNLKTKIAGSFNQFAIRYGSGIANGGDNGNSWTWNTYGAPDPQTKKFTSAYSLSIIEHYLWNISKWWTINGYGIYIKSKGGSPAMNKDEDFYGNQVYNRKTDKAIGIRTIYYLRNWFNLIGEVHYTERIDGNEPGKRMLKFTLAPTLVPNGIRDPWSRPHIRFVFSAANYNKYASRTQYSPYLQQAGAKTWGFYFGIRTEWWIY